ncbi:MFS transporter [Thermobifida fusca]|nr:MFS transporter [Thermobifida fusca]MDD6793365.1 MFS transporter [Thermobifida fusca]PZN64732.1 MAG: MFS transporter [Thermobifida fusca]
MSGHRLNSAAPDPAARRARWGVAGLFASNGLGYPSVVPWLPEIKNQLELSNTALGTAIAAMPLGALLTGMLAGPFISRWGSGRTAVVCALVSTWLLPVIALAPQWGVLVAILFVIGCVDTWCDAAMNAHGLRVQRRYGRSIINTFHAVWSVAAVAGGLLGAAAVGLRLPFLVFLIGLACMLTGLVVASSRLLLDGPEHAERSAASLGDGARWFPAARAVGLMVALGVLLMLAAAVEDAAASWGAVYMRDSIGATAFLAGLPFVACQAAMTAGRLAGDRLTDAFGAVAVARTGLLLSAVGLSGALLFPTPVTTVVGFGLCGLGVATLFPLTLAAAGEIPGVHSGTGVSMVAWLARLGFLAFPPLVGLVADATSLRVGLALFPVAALIGAALATSLRPRTSEDG